MIPDSLSRLRYLCQHMPDKFSVIPEAAFSANPHPDKWSKKEILGHLIDSATNNHHRFIRSQFEEIPLIHYNGELWVSNSYYQSMPIPHLIAFWELYNRHIAELIERIPEAVMNRYCDSGDAEPHTLAWLFEDYVVHLEHHLHQMVEY